jgi:hypothetical protein
MGVPTGTKRRENKGNEKQSKAKGKREHNRIDKDEYPEDCNSDDYEDERYNEVNGSHTRSTSWTHDPFLPIKSLVRVA